MTVHIKGQIQIMNRTNYSIWYLAFGLNDQSPNTSSLFYSGILSNICVEWFVFDHFLTCLSKTMTLRLAKGLFARQFY